MKFKKNKLYGGRLNEVIIPSKKGIKQNNNLLSIFFNNLAF